MTTKRIHPEVNPLLVNRALNEPIVTMVLLRE